MKSIRMFLNHNEILFQVGSCNETSKLNNKIAKNN
jgi:hypothetical protein